MVKRHEALVPLSREHHSHLVFAKRLREGQPESPKSNWPPYTDEEILINHIKKYFEIDMLNHFELEERILFPVYETYLELGDPKLELLNYIKDHHNIVRNKIKSLKDFSGDMLKEKIKEIGQDIESHIHKEERQLFNDIQDTLPFDELATIYKELNEKSSLTCSHLL